ncbi:hypothetical protein [Streptomyces sp. NPDC001155]
MAVAAAYPEPDHGFTANITMGGEFLSDGVTLADLADGSVEILRGSAQAVEVSQRAEVGSPEAPALTQRVTFSAVLAGTPVDLVQSQVYLSVVDARDPHRCAVIRLTLTATVTQHDSLLGDFQELLRTVKSSAGAED